MTLKSHIIFWKKLRTFLTTSCTVAVPGAKILPFEVALWNRVKGGVDTTSRLINGSLRSFPRAGVEQYLYIRLLMYYISFLLKSYQVCLAQLLLYYYDDNSMVVFFIIMVCSFYVFSPVNNY